MDSHTEIYSFETVWKEALKIGLEKHFQFLFVFTYGNTAH